MTQTTCDACGRCTHDTPGLKVYEYKRKVRTLSSEEEWVSICNDCFHALLTIANGRK